MKPTRFLPPLLGSIALLLAPAHGTEIAKLQNTTALNLVGAWSGGVVPGTGDVMLWNNLYTAPGLANTLSQLGADLSVLGLKVTNVGGTLNAATTMVGFQNTSSANTLTIGAGGIDLSAATQTLLIQSKVTIGASQTWNIANANTATNPTGLNNSEDLAFFGQAAGAALNFGGNTVTTSGLGAVTITSGFTLSNGTFNVGNALVVIQGGSSRVTTVNSNLNIAVATGSILRLQANSGASGASLNSAAPITVNGGTLDMLTNTAGLSLTQSGAMTFNTGSTLQFNRPQNSITTVSGGIAAAGNFTWREIGSGASSISTVVSGNLTGSGNITHQNTATGAVGFSRLTGDNSGYTGTFTINGASGNRSLRLASTTAGSANATWSVSANNFLQLEGFSVSLGTLTGAGTVTNTTGAATISVGAGAFTGALTDGAGTLAVTKVGGGTLTLSGTGSYSGATAVSNGTMLVSPGALSVTSVSVANGATYGAQAAVSGTLDTGVTVADGGTMLVRPQAAGVGITIPSLAVGAAGFVTVDTGTLGNPTTAPLIATTFAPLAGTKLKILGSNLTAGTFPALAYSGAIGGGGFLGLSLALPFRITGGLVDNAGVSVDVNITGTAKPAWRGNVNANWDIDSVGNGSTGTANWAAAAGPNTYVEAPVGTDSVAFDDSATGITNVNLTTALSPGGIAVGNSLKNYTFSGSGRITGNGGLTKSGTGPLVIVNAGTNDFAGGTFINDGTVTLGDGVTAGAGTLGTGTVTVNTPGTLELNRPDAFTFANLITGTGGLKKSQTNTATLSGAPTLSGPVELAAGTLSFTGGGNLGGAITGSGALTVAGGTLQLSGNDVSTFTGLTTVNSGTLQLNKTAGVNAIGGNILLTGTGGLTLLQPDQIADSATITYDKTGTNQGNVQIGSETFGVLNVINGSDTGSQMQALNGFVVTGLTTVQNTSVFAIASNNSASVGGLNVSGTATIRIAANSNPSSLTVGALGITASGGTIQVGQGTGAYDAVLNLGGDVTTTGNLAFTDGNFIGGNLRQIDLGASVRIFSIATGTTTTIAPDIAGAGGITKTGNGTLQLTAASASTYTGATTVSAGTLLTTPEQTGGGSVSVAGGATLGVNLVNAGTTLAASDVTTAGASTLQFATGALGNPAAPVLAAGAFTVGGATTIRLTGTALTSGTGIPLIGYTSIIGFGALSISLPSRMAGTLVNNLVDSRVDLNLAVEQVKWKGNVDGNWDVDPDGTGGTGTLNWLTTVANTPTRYFQGPPISNDTVNFDDTATGTTTVILTTALAPNAANVDNTTKTYTFTGPGTLTGTTALTKIGTGKLILTNANAYNHTGGTTINDGTLQIGDGVTAGAGFLPTTAVTNNATIALNRPDDFTVTGAISGSGLLVKQAANTVSFAVATTYAGGIDINGGTLLFTAAGNLSGAIALNPGKLQLNAGGSLGGTLTGAGLLEVGGGTVVINGGSVNTNTGLTTVSGGTLQLSNFGGHSVGGDVTVTGAGVLAILAPEQIPDTATLSILGTSGDSLLGTTALETVANVLVNPSVATGQLVMRAGFTVTGLATVNNGVFGVGSGQTATINAINVTAPAALVRIAGNTAASTLNVGPGGITTVGSEIQVKFNTVDNDATLNLGGDFTATGNASFSNAGYTGANLNLINLTGTRAFNIATGTTTTIAPDIAGPGGLTKTGNGTLSLLASVVGTYTGGTTINAGTLAIAGGSALDDTGAVSLANVAGAQLLLNASETIGALSGGGSTGGEVALGANTLTVGDATLATTFSGAISGTSGTVVKQGAGALTLNGLQTYGTLTTSAGTTNVNSPLGTGSSTVNANATTNFGVSQTLAALNIGSGGFAEAAPAFGADGNVASAVVPEPGSIGLLLVGALGMLGRRRRN